MKEFLKMFTSQDSKKTLRTFESMSRESESFDPKTAVVPGDGKVLKPTIEYYIFCKDPKASDDKSFMYYKKVFTREDTKEKAEQALHQIKSPYIHIIITYNPVKEEVIGAHANEAELFKLKIKEYNSQTSKPINWTAIDQLGSALLGKKKE